MDTLSRAGSETRPKRRSKSLANLAPRDNFSSYRDAATELLQKRLLTDGDKRSIKTEISTA